MARTSEMPTASEYYEALRAVMARESAVLTALLPLSGERGRNDELRFMEFLRRFLPLKYDLGTGFIIGTNPCPDVTRLDASDSAYCSPEIVARYDDLLSEAESKEADQAEQEDAEEREGAPTASAQTDIVVFDAFHNPAMFTQLAASVFPIETVYATIEVKSPLKSLDKTLHDISLVRKLAKWKRYVVPCSEPVSPDDPDKRVVRWHDRKVSLPPRSYIVAFDADWKSIRAFRAYVQRKLCEYPYAHVNGILVVEKDWFLWQTAQSQSGPVVNIVERDALLRFAVALHKGIASMPMMTMAFDGYLVSPDEEESAVAEANEEE